MKSSYPFKELWLQKQLTEQNVLVTLSAVECHCTWSMKHDRKLMAWDKVWESVAEIILPSVKATKHKGIFHVILSMTITSNT